MRRDLARITALGTAAFGSLWHAGAVQAQAVYDWSGFYLGATAGGVLSQQTARLLFPDSTDFNTSFLANTPRAFDTPSLSLPYKSLSDLGSDALGGYTPWPTEFDLGDTGFAAGFHAGYNWQFNNIVFGIEGDASLMGVAGMGEFVATDAFTLPPPPFGDPRPGSRTARLQVQSRIDSLFSIRPRVGIAFDRFLVYGTGGLAVGRASMEVNASLAEFYDNGKGTTYAANTTWQGRTTALRPGVIVGGGGEYAVSDRVRLRLEALYYNLGTIGTTATGAGTFSTNGTFTSNTTAQPFTASTVLDGVIVRGGVSVRF